MSALLPVLALLALRPEGEPWRVRLTETSVTESGHTTDAPDVTWQTRGYGLTVIAPCGFGVNYTALTTYDRGDDSVRIEHRYADASFTLGDTLLLTFGGGTGVGASHGKAKDVFIGPGFAIGSFEAYWIHRRNWVEAGEGTLASRHYQLGLGWRI